MARYRLSTDVGGTFTDFVLYNLDTGEWRIWKIATTPEDPSLGLLEGIRQMGVNLAEVESAEHGTTIATNTLIQRDGALTAFLTTEGFRDTLEIRRANRQELYDAQWTPPPPLVPRRHRLEIRERLYWNGEIATPLDEAQVADVIETLKVRDIEAVAICFLHSYQHPRHEMRVKELVQKALPNAFVTASSEVTQEMREFERGSTVAANAMLGPRVQKYLSNLSTRLKEAGLKTDVSIMQSNGGVATIDEASSVPAKLARSGPAGGAMALQAISQMTGIGELVGVDIGGTSADVSVIVGGRPRWTSPLVIEWGLPVLFPSVDVVSIGAGGGSIAWIDEGGILHVGPQSAGAVPGPVCYGKGGTEPTSTDAQLVLKRMDATHFLGGQMKIDPALSEKAIMEKVAKPLGLSLQEAADGILKILENNMLQAVRFVTVEKGYDPRDFALVGFGGGGPWYGASMARELGMKRAIIPGAPAVLSAWGLLTVDMVQDRSKTVLKRRRALRNADLEQTFNELRDSIYASFLRQGVAATAVEMEYYLDLQYYGQVYSLAISLGDLAQQTGDIPHKDDIRVAEAGTISIRLDIEKQGKIIVNDEVLESATEHFHREHEREYGHADPEQEVQVVHARVFGSAKVRKPEMKKLPRGGGVDSKGAIRTKRPVYFDGRNRETTIYTREQLKPGNRLEGPAIVEENTATTIVPPGAKLEVDEWGNMIIETGV